MLQTEEAEVALQPLIPRLAEACSSNISGFSGCAHPPHPPLRKVFLHAVLMGLSCVCSQRGLWGDAHALPHAQQFLWTSAGTAFQHGVPYGYPTVNSGHAIAGGTPVGGLFLQSQT